MATFNPVTSDIIGYVEEHTLPLISRTVLGGQSASNFTLMTGVKGNTKLNILGVDPRPTCGKTCGWHENGETAFTQKQMCVLPYNIHMAFCDKNLLDTWANYEVKVAAGLKTLPFEEEWTNNIVDNVKRQIEIQIWQGTGTLGIPMYDPETGEGLEDSCVCPGIIHELVNAEKAPIDATTAGGPYDYFVAVFNNLPDDVKAAGDLIAFVGFGLYYKLIQDIMVTSHFHVNGDDLINGFTFPGTGVRIVPTVGLDKFTTTLGNVSRTVENAMVIGRESNFFYGTDLRNDEEKFDLWYSKDNREFRLAIEYTMGATVAFIDEISWGAKIS